MTDALFRILRMSILIGLCGLLRTSFALDYYELEVYGYQTAAEDELELENATSWSSDNLQKFDNKIFRTSLELTYGVSDRWEATAYFDYTKPADETFEYTAFRGHARTRFYEKGELPVDLGAYFEVELPRNYRQEDLAFEFKPIFEKDFSRWTVRLNPSVELEHSAVDSDDGPGGTGDLDEDEDPSVQVASPHKTWRVEWGLSSSLVYNWNERIRPHLDWHLSFTDKASLLVPSLDINLIKHLKLTAGLGFGLTPQTERRIVLSRLEYEIYF
jgi:hypothetical protein